MPYEESPHFETPCHTKVLWRYMSIDKFMSILSTESLYFPNIYAFDDNNEGTLSKKSSEEVYKTNLFNEKNTPIKQNSAYVEMKKHIEERVDRFPKDREDIIKNQHSFETLLRDFSNYLMFCSSWFKRDSESHSMWAEYGDKSPTSIAIQTTVGDLIKSFEESIFDIHIGKVKYKDYKKEHIEGYEDFLSEDLTDPNKVLELFYAPILHKRNIYDDEHEVRAIISFESICKKYLDGIIDTSKIPFYSDNLFEKDFWMLDGNKTNLMSNIPTEGIPVKTTLKTLIKKIIISPNAYNFFLDTLNKLLEKYNMNPGIVKKTAINNQSFF